MTTKPIRKPCPKCKGFLEEEGTALGAQDETTIWEVCSDECGYTRASEVREASND